MVSFYFAAKGLDAVGACRCQLTHSTRLSNAATWKIVVTTKSKIVVKKVLSSIPRAPHHINALSLGVSGESIYVIRGDLSLPSDAVKISTLIETHNVTK